MGEHLSCAEEYNDPGYTQEKETSCCFNCRILLIRREALHSDPPFSLKFFIRVTGG